MFVWAGDEIDNAGEVAANTGEPPLGGCKPRNGTNGDPEFDIAGDLAAISEGVGGNIEGKDGDDESLSSSGESTARI